MADFALPVGHTPVTGGTVVTIPVTIRRPFRQPLVLNDSNNFFKGTEIWLEASVANNAATNLNDKLFIIFKSVGRYYPGTTPQQEAAGEARKLPRFEYKITDPVLVNAIQGIAGRSQPRTMMEAAVRNIIYENIDRTSVITALATLIEEKYTASLSQAAALWHPILTNRIRPAAEQNQAIRAYIQAQIANGATLATIANTVATAIVDQTYQQPVQVSLLPGDWIGRAAALPAQDALPNFAPPNTFTSPRLIRIIMQDIGLFEINPGFYFLKFLQNANFATVANRTLTLISYAPLNNNTFNHPFLTALNINLTQQQLPRITVNMTLTGEAAPRNALFFPVSKALNTWRGNQLYLPNDPGATVTSIAEWHINNIVELPLEFRRRAGQDPGHTRIRLCSEPAAQGNTVDVCVTVTASPQNAYWTRANSVWNNFRTPIQDICQILQIPVELLVTTIGCEASSTLDPRSIALEPITLDDNVYVRLVQNGTIPGTIPQSFIDSYRQMTTNERYGRIVPNPFNPNIAVSNVRPGFVTVTWGHIRDYLAGYFPHRLSPGAAQTLVETAMGELRWLQTYYPNLPQTFAVDAVNTQSNVANNIAMFDWLLTARHSILASCARQKHSYQKFSTYFDIVRSGTVYNANGTSDHPRTSDGNVFGYRFYGNNPPYPVKAGKYYNSLKLLFRTATNPNNGSPQFWQALPE